MKPRQYRTRFTPQCCNHVWDVNHPYARLCPTPEENVCVGGVIYTETDDEDICHKNKCPITLQHAGVRSIQMRTVHAHASAMNNLTCRDPINCAAVPEVVDLVYVFPCK